MQKRPVAKIGEERRFRVFLADDEQSIMDTLEEQIKSFPKLTVVGTSSSALDTIEQLRETRADLLILDINFSRGKTGLQIIDQLKNLQPNLKILVITGLGQHYQNRSFLAKANGFLLKPFHPEELAEAMVAVLAGRLFYNEAILQEQSSQSITDDDRLSYEDREYLQARLSGISDKQYAKERKIKMETISQRRYRIGERLKLTTDIETWLFRVVRGTGKK